jgi:hypothetical protein
MKWKVTLGIIGLMVALSYHVYSQAGAGGSTGYSPSIAGSGGGGSGGGSGPAVQGPTNTFAWFKSDTGLTLGTSTNLVEGWADQSGHTNDVLYFSGTKMQQISNVLNGYPAIRGVATDSGLVNTNGVVAGTSWTIIYVATCGSAQTQYEVAFAIRDPGNARWALQMGNDPLDGLGWVGAGAGTDLGPKALLTNQAYTRSYVKSSTAWNVYQNGSQIVTNIADTSGPVTSVSEFGIGAEYDGIVASRSLIGDVFEVIIYRTALSDANRQEVETYLKNRYQHY